MHRLFRYVTATSLAVTATAVVIAQLPPPALNVKLGLWEMTTSVDMGGNMAGMMGDMSKIPPAQRAQMEAMMKQMAQPHTDKKCLTKEEMSKGLSPNEPGESCKDAVVTNTSSVYEIKRECTGDRKESTTLHFETAGSELIKGTMNSTVVKSGQTQNVKATISGKWLGADCGNVK